jgi:hypothetical protein
MERQRRPAPFDYDDDAFRAGIGRVSGLDRDPGFDGCILREGFRDVHPRVADGLEHAGLFPVLDLGCGIGTLGRLLDERRLRWAGIDRSRKQLAAGFGPRLRGEATRLPFGPRQASGAWRRCTCCTTWKTRCRRSGKRAAS